MCATYVKIIEVYWRVTTQPPRDAGRFERSGGPRSETQRPLRAAASRRCAALRSAAPKGLATGRVPAFVCVCLLLQDLVQSCLRGEGGILEDMCYKRRRAEACVD